jgi:hypothetical protein
MLTAQGEMTNTQRSVLNGGHPRGSAPAVQPWPWSPGVWQWASSVAPWAVSIVLVLVASPAWAQTPREIPYEGFGLRDERVEGPFTVQRWVSSEAPEVSPAGMCQCITVVYAGERRVLSLGVPGQLSADTVVAPSGADIDGDGSADLVVTSWSGGAHCCYSTQVYSVGAEVRRILSLDTGHCGPGEFADLDGDGWLEFTTCDDQWAYAYCSFADSPFPRVVYAYDPVRGDYAPATPRYAIRFRDELALSLGGAQTWMAESGGKDPGLDKCRLLQPVLGLMYAGRIDDGLVLIRGLYRADDREQFEAETVERVRQSALWVPK